MAGVVVIPLFVLATALDMATMDPAREANQLVLALGDAAYLARGLVIVAVVSLAYVLARTRYRWVIQVVAGIGVCVGLTGFVSNIA